MSNAILALQRRALLPAAWIINSVAFISCASAPPPCCCVAAACRLFQPHPKQLASRQAMPAMSSGGDDLQTQMLLRDQLQAMPQQHQVHHAQQYAEAHQASYVQDRSGSSLSAAMSASGGAAALHQAHHALMQPQVHKPATLSKAVAGVMANPKGWQERLDSLNALSDALNRQVGCQALSLPGCGPVGLCSEPAQIPMAVSGSRGLGCCKQFFLPLLLVSNLLAWS